MYRKKTLKFNDMKKLVVILALFVLAGNVQAANQTTKDGSKLAEDNVIIELIDALDESTISIYDLNGELVKRLAKTSEDKNLIQKSDLIFDDGKNKIYILSQR
jgi:hypothetical protein